MDKLELSEELIEKFAPQYRAVSGLVPEGVGTSTEGIVTRPAHFGPPAFIGLIRSLQLELTGVDISLAAPLPFDAKIDKGDIAISDMFSLYKHESMLYTIDSTGAEIKGFLEELYAMWINRTKSPDDHVLLSKRRKRGQENYVSFVNFSFDFDSVAGIIYTVNVVKPKGERIAILRMTGGRPFDENKTYRVTLNSYRGNEGGELLMKGADIPQDGLKSHIIRSTDKDLHYYMIWYIKEKGVFSPRPLNQWQIIPQD